MTGKSLDVDFEAALRVLLIELADNSEAFPSLERLSLALDAQLRTPELAVGVAGEPWRGREAVAELLRVEPSVRVSELELVAGAPPPAGCDVWVVVLAADQLASLRERELVRDLGVDVARSTIVLVNHLDRVPADREASVLEYARTQLAPYGIRREHVLAWNGEAARLALRALLGALAEDQGALRAAAVRAAVRPVRDALRPELDAVNAELKGFGDPWAIRRELAELELAIKTAADALRVLGPDFAREHGEELLSRWDVLVDELAPAALKAPVEERGRVFGRAVSERLKSAFVPRVAERVRGLISRLSSELPGLARELGGLRVEPGEVWTELAIDDAAAGTRASGVRMPGQWVRVVLPAVGAAIGFAARGKKYALFGAAAGSAVGFGLRRLERSGSRRAIAAWKAEAVRELVEAHLRAVSVRAMEGIAKELERAADLRIRGLKEARSRSELEAPKREGVEAKHKELLAMVNAMDAVCRS